MTGRSGWTLIELLAVTVVTALLMALLTGVLRSVVRQRDWIMTLQERAPAVTILQDQLRRDLDNTTHIVTGKGWVKLDGLLAEDPATRRPVHRPGEVVYAIATIAGRRCLVRRVRETAGGRGGPMRQAVLWAGVSTVTAHQFQSPRLPGDEQDATDLSPSMPSSARMELYDDRGRLVCRVEVVR